MSLWHLNYLNVCTYKLMHMLLFYFFTNRRNYGNTILKTPMNVCYSFSKPVHCCLNVCESQNLPKYKTIEEKKKVYNSTFSFQQFLAIAHNLSIIYPFVRHCTRKNKAIIAFFKRKCVSKYSILFSLNLEQYLHVKSENLNR